ncbi:MAG: hypothetical protein K8R36_08890 [Planctomycetales bacterium]|nr:hypothetical protein [Planctomycetales bacterium]
MIKQALPYGFLDKCTDAERSDIETWWQSLHNDSQSDVRVLLDRRNDSRAYIYADDESGRRDWHVLPIGDDDLPFDDPEEYEREWQADYFQHLLDHPELAISPDAVVRTFHICTAHPAARRVAVDGELTSDFQCPVHDDDCPIRAFASTIKTARLLKMDPKTRHTTWLCKQ